MGFRSTIEDHAAVVFLAALVTGFAAGWGAHVAAQGAGNVTPLSRNELVGLQNDTAALHRLEKKVREDSIRADSVSRYAQAGGPTLPTFYYFPDSLKYDVATCRAMARQVLRGAGLKLLPSIGTKEVNAHRGPHGVFVGCLSDFNVLITASYGPSFDSVKAIVADVATRLTSKPHKTISGS